MVNFPGMQQAKGEQDADAGIRRLRRSWQGPRVVRFDLNLAFVVGTNRAVRHPPVRSIRAHPCAAECSPLPPRSAQLSTMKWEGAGRQNDTYSDLSFLLAFDSYRPKTNEHPSARLVTRRQPTEG